MKKNTLFFLCLVICANWLSNAQSADYISSSKHAPTYSDGNAIFLLSAVDEATLYYDKSSNKVVLSDTNHKTNILYEVNRGEIGNSILINGNGNDNNLTVDTSIIQLGIDILYKGGAQKTETGDILTLDGSGKFDTIEHRFINENDGSVVFDNQTTVTYIGLEPVIDNLNVVNRIFSFTGAAETITLGDDLIANDGVSLIDSNLGESVTFTNPTASLRINTEALGGSGADTIDVEGLDGLFDANLNIVAGTDDEVVFDTNPTDIGNGDYTIAAQTIIVRTNVSTGTAGELTFNAFENIEVRSGAVVSTVDGDLTFNANAGGTGSGPEFLAILLNSGNVLTSGAGDIDFTGVGSSAGGGSTRIGIRSFNSSTIETQGTGSISLDGRGGNGSGVNIGVRIDGATTFVRSNGAGINIVGVAGNGTSVDNTGVYLSDGVTIEDTTTGMITIVGTGGTGSNSNRGIVLLNNTSEVRTNGGGISMTGIGGNATGSSNRGILLTNGLVNDLSAGNIVINSTGGSGINNNEGIALTGDSAITATDGNLTIGGIASATGTNNNGIRLTDSSLNSTNGDIDITGTAGSATSSGFRISDLIGQVDAGGNVSITTTNGPFTTAAGVPAIDFVNGSSVTVNGETNPGFDVQGILTIAGNTSLSLGDILSINFVGVMTPNPGTNFDQLDITGSVDITDATLNLIDGVGGLMADGAVYTIINNDGSDAVVGTFNGQPNGSLIPFNGQNFFIFYDGGDGNDVELVLDSQPIAVCQDITVQLDATGNVSIVPADIDNGSSDADGPVTLSLDITSFTCADVGPNTVTLTVTDTSGNMSSCTATVTVEDNILPSVACMDITIQLDGAGNATIVPSDVNAGASDNCGISTIDIDISTFDCSNVGPNNVTLLVMDVNGNFNSCVAVVTVEDNVLPMAVCQDITIQLDLTGNVSITPADVDGGSSDNCGISTTSIDISSFDCSDLGPNDVVLTVTDVNGNISMCTAVVTVENNNGLNAVCQDITVQLDAAGMAMIIPSDIDGGSVNNCPGGNAYSIDIDTFDCTNVGPNNVVLTVTDASGNSSSCTAVVTVEDNVLPMVLCLDITVVLDGSGMVSIVPADVDGGSSDACGIDTITIDIDTFDCTNVGPNNVTLTVTDFNGNVSTCVAVVTVEDNDVPVAVCQDITVQLDATGTVTILPIDVDGGSTDNCGNTVSTLDIDTFDCTNVGTPVTVTLTITDPGGNMSSCTAIVTVEDNVDPMAVCQDITINLDSNGMATIVPADIDGGSTDACGISSVSISMNTFDCSNVGPNNVTLSVSDVNGNTSSCVAIVTVEEENAVPMAVCQNLTVPLQQDGTATITPQNVNAGSSGEGCFNGLTLDIDTFDCSDIGTPVTVTLTVTNGNGDTSSCTAIITIVDSIGPEVTCPEDQLIEVIDTFILPDYFATGEATAIDNCTDPVTIFSQDPPAGTALGFGVYTIELTATDDFGHSGTCSFELTIGDILGVEDEALLNTIILYPNPAKEFIMIDNPQNVELKQLLIYDLLGRQVQVENLEGIGTTKSIDVSNLQSATYLFVIQSENGQLIKQVVKK